MRLIAVLFASVLAAGCLDAVQSQVGKLRGAPPAPEPFVGQWSDLVAPSTAKTYPVPVERGATRLAAELTLSTTSPGGGPAPPVNPAQVTLSVRDPSGATVGESATANPQAPSARLQITTFPAFGDYTLVVSGQGLSGNNMGARFNLTARVAYEP